MLQHEFPELWLVILCPFSPREFPLWVPGESPAGEFRFRPGTLCDHVSSPVKRERWSSR